MTESKTARKKRLKYEAREQRDLTRLVERRRAVLKELKTLRMKET